MLGAQGESGILVGVGEDLFHFLQAGGGDNKAQLPAGFLFRMVSPAGQTETVHGHGGDGIVGDLKLHAGVDGASLIFGHGKQGAADQFPELVLRNTDGTAGVDIGQLWVILSAFGGDGKGSVTGTDGHLEVIVHNYGDRAFRQPADNVTEELGRQDALAGVGDFGVDGIGNGGFHIVAGEA